jgi:ankyrin repeat protein
MASPLINFIKNNDTINALALIETGDSHPEIPDDNGKTALIYACIKGIPMSDVALALIRTNNSNPDQVDADERTALIYACLWSMNDVALALIETRNSNPGYTDAGGYTALICACMVQMSDVALALIATGDSNPSQVNRSGSTALTKACALDMPAVALALIATGDSNPSQVDGYGRTALIYAQEHENMQEVVGLLVQIPGVAPVAEPVAPPVVRGVAFEIHNFFNLLDINKITKFITQFNDSKPEFNNNVLQFSLDPLLSPLINFVNNTYPENVKQEKINGLTSINASIASYGNYDQMLPLLQKVITFVSKQSDEFIALYIDMLKYDCLNAYAGSNRSSCIKGMVERIITVLKDVAIGLLTKDPDNENYVKLKDIFMEFNEFIGEWSNTYLEDGPKRSELEALTEVERENHFITFMVKKYTDDDDPDGRECSPDGSKCSTEMCAKIKTEAAKFRDGGVFKNLVMGGNKKRYKRKTHKKKITRKKSTRKKLQKSYKKGTKRLQKSYKKTKI